MKLLEEAGWQVVDGKLTKDGRPFRFEILLDNPIWERISLPFAQNLARLGIEASVRTVDTAQYKNRVDHYDFDVAVNVWGESPSPGNEQFGYWTSAAADEIGGNNLVGIKNPAVDALVERLVAAPDRETLVARTRALDRVLLWNHYVIPQWHLGVDRVAYWDKFGMPKVIPAQGVQLFAWWIKPGAALAAGSRPASAERGAHPPAGASPAPASSSGGDPWLWLAIGGGGVAALLLMRNRRRRD